MNQNQEYIGREKHNQLQLELEHLKTVARKEVAKQLDYAKSLGDLSENAEYHEARDKQADIEDRIKQIESKLRQAIIVDEQSTGHHKVGIGSKVKILKKGSTEALEFTLVGSEEADMENNKISYQSPLGGALLGHKKGELITVDTPKGTVEYTIEAIK